MSKYLPAKIGEITIPVMQPPVMNIPDGWGNPNVESWIDDDGTVHWRSRPNKTTFGKIVPGECFIYPKNGYRYRRDSDKHEAICLDIESGNPHQFADDFEVVRT